MKHQLVHIDTDRDSVTDFVIPNVGEILSMMAFATHGAAAELETIAQELEYLCDGVKSGTLGKEAICRKLRELAGKVAAVGVKLGDA